MPDPLGKKSRPTIFSNSEDLPLDCVPMLSKSMYPKQQFLEVRYINEDQHL